jgi:hypothetical protein
MSGDKSKKSDFGKRGRDAEPAEARLTAVQRLKRAGTRWWGALGTAKTATRGKGFKRTRS